MKKKQTTVILVSDNQVLEYKTYSVRQDALDRAVKLADHMGSSHTRNSIIYDLEKEGFYVPSNYYEWSITFTDGEIVLDASEE